jgi:ketosteroid isomerase-like protein
MPDEAWVDELVAACNAFDGEKAGSFYAPDAVWRDEALDMNWEGRDAITEVWSTQTPAAIPDLHMDVAALVCSNDGLAVEWRMTGTMKDSGSKFDTPGVSVCHLRDGLIVKQTDYYNAADFHTQ